jgi:hypothetical protein
MIGERSNNFEFLDVCENSDATHRLNKLPQRLTKRSRTRNVTRLATKLWR